MKTTKLSMRALSQAEVEACELEAHAAVPDDAVEKEAQVAYVKALRKAVRKRRRASSEAVTVSLTGHEDIEG